MPVFKKDLTALSENGAIVKNAGKGSTSQPRLSRGALNTVTRGAPTDRALNNYSKATPMANPLPEPPSYPGA